jgi:hypothetical protein
MRYKIGAKIWLYRLLAAKMGGGAKKIGAHNERLINRL